jgi:exosortase
MATSAANVLTQNTKRHASFIAFVTGSCVIFHKALSELIWYSMHDGSSSHTILIPVIAFYLLYLERDRIVALTKAQNVWGIAVTLLGLLLYWSASRASSQQDGTWLFSLQILSVLIVWVGGFLLCYGVAALRAAAFPILFLLMMVPLPSAILDHVIYALQAGSTMLSYLIFQAVGTPVIRHGFLLSVPGVTIEVAKECSSIRSSIALLITCLLAAHLYLRSTWKKILFVFLSLIVSVIKNGIRIATLTLLSIHVDPSFLTGKLHHQGGFVFFLVALLILFPVLFWLQKSERVSAVAPVET